MSRMSNIWLIQLIPSSVSRDVIIVLLVFLLWSIPGGLIQSFISPYFFELSKGDYFLTGFLNGIPFFTMVFSIFIFGRIVDKVGSKKVMIVSFTILAIMSITLVFITDPIIFFIDYVVMNSLLGGFNPAIMKYASLTRKKGIFGSMGVFASLGYFIGSVLSGWVYETVGLTISFAMTIMVCILGLSVTLFSREEREFNPELFGEIKLTNDQCNSASTSSIAILACSKILIVLFVISIIHGIINAFSGVFATIYLLNDIGAPAVSIGLIFGTAAITGMVASHFTGKIGEKRGYKEILIICYIIYFLVWSSFLLSTSDYLLPALLYSIPAYVGLFVGAPAIVTANVPESKRGTLMGIFGACQNLGYALGAGLGGLISGLQGSFKWNFAVSAVLSIILVAIIFIFLKEKKSVRFTRS